MANLPKKVYSLGKCQAAIFLNEQYNSQSIKLSKSYQNKEGKWANTDFFNTTDLRDLAGLINGLLQKQIKERVPGQTPSGKTAQKETHVDERFDFDDGQDVPF